MNLLAQLNACCRRLWRDESGVVLAFTVIVFLTLFVIACSVYAVGENIRQRIELQNAADSAAYSAAVVQADAISRIAAINKALAWTHVQMGRSEMDYAVDVWLQLTLTKWQIDYWTCFGKISGYSSCPLTFLNSWIGSQVGWYPGCLDGGNILINQNNSYNYPTLFGFWKNAAFPLQSKINNYRDDIKKMNGEEAAIRDLLQDRMFAVVTNVLQRDTGYPNPQDFQYSLVDSPASDYFTTLKDEARLLKYFDPQSDAGAAFKNDGINVWFNLLGGDGIWRGYQQQANSLRADWRWHLEGWIWTHWGPRRVFMENGSDTVRGSDALHNPAYYQTEPVKAQILTSDYFGPKGAIVVSVARKMSNPLVFMMADQSKPGLYAFFNPGSPADNPRYTWASAAARAGYLQFDGGTGEYWTQDSGGWINSRGNLSQADWDAELIPLQPVTTPQQLWNSPTWKPLFGNASSGTALSSMAGGAAPAGVFLH